MSGQWRYYCGDLTCHRYGREQGTPTDRLEKSRATGVPVTPVCPGCGARCYYAQPGVPVPAERVQP